MISIHKYSFCSEENHLHREKSWMWPSHDVKDVCLPEKPPSWDSRKHPAILTWRQSHVFSGFTEGRWLQAVWAVRAFSIAFLLDLACCFLSNLGNVPRSKLHSSVLGAKQELVQVDPRSVQLLLNTKELLTQICAEKHVQSPRACPAVSVCWVAQAPP